MILRTYLRSGLMAVVIASAAILPAVSRFRPQIRQAHASPPAPTIPEVAPRKHEPTPADPADDHPPTACVSAAYAVLHGKTVDLVRKHHDVLDDSFMAEYATLKDEIVSDRALAAAGCKAK